jgi:hypothetical protein
MVSPPTYGSTNQSSSLPARDPHDLAARHQREYSREVKIYCCAAMDSFSRNILGRSIDSTQGSNLVINALDMR